MERGTSRQHPRPLKSTTSSPYNGHQSTSPRDPHPVSVHNDAVWIANQIKGLYKPHTLPKEINQLNTLIKYSDGVELRKICNFIRANEWAQISGQKLQSLREEFWEKMRTNRIPQGKLRENFTRTFGTYLPTSSRPPRPTPRKPN